MSEPFLDSSTNITDTRINLNSYQLSWADHPCITSRGGVLVYYKDYLTLIRRTDLSNFQEGLVTEITIDKEKYFLNCSYRSPSQNELDDDELKTFCFN